MPTIHYCQHIDCKYFLQLLQLCNEQGICGKLTKVYDLNFNGGRTGLMDGEGGSSEIKVVTSCSTQKIEEQETNG